MAFLCKNLNEYLMYNALKATSVAENDRTNIIRKTKEGSVLDNKKAKAQTDMAYTFACEICGDLAKVGDQIGVEPYAQVQGVDGHTLVVSVLPIHLLQRNQKGRIAQ